MCVCDKRYVSGGQGRGCDDCSDSVSGAGGCVSMKVSCEAAHQGSLGRAWKQISWLYYQYLLVTALYMLEPWERTIFSILPCVRRGHCMGM